MPALMELLCTGYEDQRSHIVRYFEYELMFNELIEGVVEDLLVKLEVMERKITVQVEGVMEDILVKLEAMEPKRAELMDPKSK